MKKVFLIIIVGGLLFLVGCQKQVTTSDTEQSSPVSNQASHDALQLANPASQYCLDQGGKLEIRKNQKQEEYGVCLFEDNLQCEEWALLRNQCPVGGLKVTGYENEAEVYCAITGGQVEGVGTETPMCQRVDGTYCNAEANWNGDCPDPNDLNPSAGNVEVP